MAKDAYIHIRVDEDLKQAAKQHAADTGRTLAGLIEWLLRKELNHAGSLKRGGQIGGFVMYNQQEMLKKVGVRTMEELDQIGHWNGECWTVDGMTIKPQHRQRGEDDFELIGYTID